jgi:hypothetical protein
MDLLNRLKKPVLAKKAAKPAAAPKTNPVIKLKDTIMDTAKNTDITAARHPARKGDRAGGA